MNKELLDQLSSDERQVAENVSSAAEMMKLSQSFQWNLETKLMDAYPSQNERQNSLMKFLKPIGWVLAAVAGILLVSWVLRTLLPGIQPAAEPTPAQEVSFEANVRQGNICAGPLAVAHNFAVYLTSPDKTQFAEVTIESPMYEIRSAMWSTEGEQLALLVNEWGHGNIYIADSNGTSAQPILVNSELGYADDAAWSRDSRQFATWTPRNNKVLYLINSDGSGVVEIPLNVQILGAPQFSPDGRSVVFLGADTTATGLFEIILNDTKATLMNASIESATSYAFSPDGTKLAYMKYDRENGEARLIAEDLTTHEVEVHGGFTIPKGSGSSVPQTANMSWSSDGKWLVFDVGRGANDRVMYLAPMDRLDMLRSVGNGRAPAISSDGRCLAFMNDQQVFLMDLNQIETAIPLSIGDLPAGRGGSNYQLDKLQWKP